MEKYKEFKPTSWSIDNRTAIYVLAVIIAIFGLRSYNSIPKEQFPEIIIPTIVVSTVYPGTSPSDMENLITRPLEKNIKAANGVRKVTSNAVQDFSSIVVEFNTDIDVAEAKQRVKDAVDKTKQDLPNDLPDDPNVMEIDFSEFPIMNINISGNYDLDKLKKYAEMAQDKIESLKEITRVDIVGALDREIQIDVDMFKMQSTSVTFSDIERAISNENMTIAGGTLEMQGMRRSVRVVGEFANIETIKNIIFTSGSGASVRLTDIAEIKDNFKDQDSYARLNGKNVITLNVIKKSGQNLIDAADQTKVIMADLQESKYPDNLEVLITGDMSQFTKTTLNDLNNTIIIGFILVTIVLMFFMGLVNAIFVGLSIPLAMALSYLVLPGIDFTMNMLVMFAFIFALGIVVDDAIVVVENTHRIHKKMKMSIVDSAKFAAGEVFVPILSGTLTTLAPFFPLAFWPGVIGKFMYFIPVTLIIALFASLIVAYIINPVFAVTFMKSDEEEKPMSHRNIFSVSGLILALVVSFHLAGWPGMGNLTAFVLFMFLFHNYIGYRMIKTFQKRYLPALLNGYEKLLRRILKGNTPYWSVLILVILFVVSIIITGLSNPKVVFFPENEPNNAFVYVKMPVGTDVKTTDSVTMIIEERVEKVLGKNNLIVESVQANVALGASESKFDGGQTTANKAKVTIHFVEFAERHGESTSAYMDKIRKAVKDIPGAEISVEKEAMGPPVGKPISLEMTGDDLETLVNTSQAFIKKVDSLKIGGLEQLKADFDNNKPELVIKVDRKRANAEGITTAQIGSELRTAILGKEISKFRDGEDQYPIQLRHARYQRENIERLMSIKITYRDMNSGMLRRIPISSVATIAYENTYGGINRKDGKRIITLTSNVLSGYTPNEINKQLDKVIKQFPIDEGTEIRIAGENEDQKESMSFLTGAMMLSLFLILFILITQFNSIGKSLIIISEVLFSIIGVLLGFTIFKMSFSVIMTGMGVVALAGIVVRNGILLVEFTDKLLDSGMRTREAIIMGGKTRITPVLLTATATILGLVPLAIGFNIDFVGLFTSFEPNIHFGGDSVTFFGGLSWTIIFGLTFATVLTLLFIPIMYFILHASQISFSRFKFRIKKKYWHTHEA